MEKTLKTFALVCGFLTAVSAAAPAEAQIAGLQTRTLNPGHVYRNNIAFDHIHGVYLMIVNRPPVTGRFLDRNGNRIGSDFVIATEPGNPYTAWASVTFGGPAHDPTFLVTYIEANLDTNPKWGRLVRFVPGSAPNVSGRSHILDVFTEWHTAEKAQNAWDGQQFIVGSRLRATITSLPRPAINRIDLNGNVTPTVVLGDTADFYGMPSIACANNAVCMVMGFAAGIPAGYAGGSYAQLFQSTSLGPLGALFLLASGNANEDQGVVYQAHTGRFLTHWARYFNGTGYIDTRLVGTDGSLSVLDLNRGFGGPGAGANAIAYNAGTATTLLVTKGDPATGPLIVMELGDDGYPRNAANTVLITEWDFKVLDYVPSVAANPLDGQWLVTADLDAAGVSRIIQGNADIGDGGAAAPSDGRVRLNADGNGDAFVYRASTGQWGRQTAMSGGGFQSINGGWAPGWSVLSGSFDGDQLSDFFVSNAVTGQWFRLLNDGNGFNVQATGFWWPGWEKEVLDMNGDGLSDLFLHDPASGQWFQCITTPGGFSYLQGFWAPHWDPYPMNLNGDAREDLFLLNRATGQWYWAISGPGGGFSYPQTGTWASDWQLYPGDFSGDGLTDLILHRPATGDYFVAITAWFGFTYTRGGWTPGFAPTVMDLDANNRADLFLYDRNTGQWFEHLSDGLGHFVNVGSGGWNPGWDLYPTDFNNDLRADLLLYNPVTGQYFQAWNFGLGGFMYFSGFWNTGLTIVTGRPR